MTRNLPRFKDRLLSYQLTLWQRVVMGIIATCMALTVILFLLSVLASPTSVSSPANVLILSGIVGIAAVTVVATLIVPLAFRLVDEYVSNSRSEKALLIETQSSERGLKPRLSGIQQLVHRRETDFIFEKLQLGIPILLTGEAGIGKSGIGVALVNRVRQLNAFPLLIDARHLLQVTDIAHLRSTLGIDEPIDEVVQRLGRTKRLFLILDQLDNTVGSPSCRVLMDFAIESTKYSGVSVVVISRHREPNEQGALRPLLEAGFQESPCRPLESDTIRSILQNVGLTQVSAELIRLVLVQEVANTTLAD